MVDQKKLQKHRNQKQNKENKMIEPKQICDHKQF